MGNKFKRFLSLALVLVMVFSFVPASVFAAEGQDLPPVEDGNYTDIPDEGDGDDVVDSEEPGDGDSEEPDEGDSEEPGDGDSEEPDEGDSEEPDAGDSEDPDAGNDADIDDQDLDDGDEPEWDGATIASVDDLMAFAAAVNAGDTFVGKTVTLTADIDLTGKVWTPIGTSNYDKTPTTSGVKMFAGTFDGGNHTITGLSSVGYVPDASETGSTEYSFGLFGYAYGANFKNVKFANVNIECSTRTNSDGNTVYGSGNAALVGYYVPADGKTSVISNCHVLSGTISASNNMGGLIGHFNSQKSQPVVDVTIVDCSNAASVTSEAREAGGILGLINGEREDNIYVVMRGTITFKNCVNTGAVTTLDGSSGATCAGGILGRDNAAFTGQRLKIIFDGCTNSGTITINANGESHVAGLGTAYYSNGSWLVAKNCKNTGAIVVNNRTSKTYAGELFAYAGVVDLINSTATGNFEGVNKYVGDVQHILFVDDRTDYTDTIITGYTYYLNGGTSPEYAALVDDAAGGGNFHLVETANKAYNEFAGWYDNAELTGDAYTAINTNVKTYYAKWKPTAVAKIGETVYKTLADAVVGANANDTITLVNDVVCAETVVVNKNVTIDLNGKTITTVATAADVFVDAFTILADVTITGEGTIDARPSHGYTFYVGDKEGNAGNLTIENGKFYGETSVVNNRLGTVTVKDGYFEVSLEKVGDAYEYTLNCVDENYKNGTAKIVVTGGSFKNWNPADNGAESGGHTNFCADGYLPEETQNGVYTVRVANYVADVNGTKYESFKDAIAAANGVEGGATVTLLKDVTLGEMLTITGNVTISGEKTITRADDWVKTLFTVNAGATLTLDGGLTIDGGNEWIFDKDGYEAALWANDTNYSGFAFAKTEENAPVATARMFVVNGSMVVNSATVQNHMGKDGCGLIGLSGSGSLTLNNGATFKHNATSHSSVIANVAAGASVTINKGVLITDNYYAKNGGVFQSAGLITMNGGEISHNVGVNTNGTVAMMYTNNAKFIMNDGLLYSNSSVRGSGAGRCAAIYLHQTGIMEMNGGTICHNIGSGYGGIDTNQISGTSLTITGGSVVNNISINNNLDNDISWPSENTGASISGGTFTQDVSAWLAPDTGLVYDEETGTYGTTDHIYNLWFRDPVTGEQVPGVGPLMGNDPASLVATGKLFYADYYNMELEVLTNAKIDETIVIDYPMTVNLNGHTITTAATEAGEYVDAFTILADVTITGEGTIDARPSHGYTFYVGDKVGNEGNLTIENGTFYGEASVVNNRLGTVTVNGGNYEVSLENADGTYDYVLNCIDDNYKAGTAKIVVKGGTFYKFNPADNGAESGGHTNFCAEGYVSEGTENGVYTVRVNKDTLDPIVTVTFKVDGVENTLKYPSERYDTIQKLIGTNSYADFVLGAEQSELLAYIANGTVSDIVITLHDDIELDAPINFYNKYFQIPVEYAVTLNGNGKTITWADGYTGTLINVESGVSLTMNDVTIDGENAFTFYNDTTTVENDQNWYTRFVNVGDEDKAVNADVIVNAGDLALNGVTIKNVTIASDGTNGKTENAGTGYVLKYNDNLAIIKANGGTVALNGATITGNAGQVLNAINAVSTITDSTINGNMGCGRNGGILEISGGTADISNNTSISGNKAMARSATILGVINGAEISFNATMDNNKHLGVGSNTAGAMIVLEGASQFVMNGGSISNNVGGRAGAIASRWVGGSYGQHEDTSIVLNAGSITGNTADEANGWNGASIFLRSPATISEGMKIEGTIVVNASPAELDITGGNFTDFKLIVTDGLSAEITGGTFDADPTEWLAEGYVAHQNADGTYTAREQLYVEWVQEQLFAGNSVTLTEDIVITDYDMIHAHKWPSNGNGKYTEVHGNGAIFHVIKPDVVLDLNGHSITWDAHDDAYCNKRQVSLFMVTITGNAGETSSLTVKDSASGGKIDVYGMGTGMYVVGVGATGTIEGGTWTNYPCKTCEASNIFIYPSHGGKLVISGGTFEQKDSEYLLGMKGSTKETTNNGVGTDFDATEVVISGGTFVNFDPEQVKFFDNAGSSTAPETVNGCELGFASEKDADGNYGVKPWNYEIHDKNDLVMFNEMAAAGDKFSGKTVKLMTDIDLGGITWTPIASFAGIFDGGNNTISNFNIDATAGHGGFFNVLEWATVIDLKLEEVTATVGAYRFGTLARSINQTNIDNVTIKNVKVTTTDSTAFVAGLFCHGTVNSNMEVNNCTVEDLTVNAENGAYLIGGITTFVQKNGTEAEGTNIFENLHVKNFKVVVNDTDGVCGVGGLVGQTQSVWQNPRFNDCSVSGLDVTASGNVDVGGFMCYPGSWTYAENCTAQGKIDVTGVTSASNFAGGFFGNYGWGDNVGKGDHKVTNCTAEVDIITKTATAGGFVGSGTNSEGRNKNITLTNCKATGKVTVAEGGTAIIGGFAGETDRGIYINCSAAQDPFIGYVAAGKTLTNSGSYVAMVGDSYYAFFDNALEAAKADNSKTVTLLAPVVITEDTTLDLTGVTVNGNGVYPAFRIQDDADVIVKGGVVTNSDYVFTLGASDLTSAGYLTIESGSYTGMTSVASVTKGTLTVTGGEFSIIEEEAYDYAYLLNCYDPSYKDGTAKIFVKGGSFKNWNPENNEAEGVGTNFCAEGKYAYETESNIWTIGEAVAHNVQQNKGYSTLTEAMNAAQAGETVKLMASTCQESILMVPAGVTFDLNGNTLSVEYAVIAFGHVIDTAETTGGIMISADAAVARTSLLANNEYMPIYDSANGCYRFFKTTTGFIVNRGAKAGNDEKTTAKFGFTLYFDKLEAYKLLAAGGHAVNVRVTVSVGNSSANYILPEAMMKAFGEKAVSQMTSNGTVTASITLTIKGVDRLETGTELAAFGTAIAEGTNVTYISGMSTYIVE